MSRCFSALMITLPMVETPHIKHVKCKPHGGTTGKVWGPPKSVGLIHKILCMSLQNYTTIHEIVTKVFQALEKTWSCSHYPDSDTMSLSSEDITLRVNTDLKPRPSELQGLQRPERSSHRRNTAHHLQERKPAFMASTWWRSSHSGCVSHWVCVCVSNIRTVRAHFSVWVLL